MLHHVERRLRTEPTRGLCSHRLVRIRRILAIDLDCHATRPSSRRIRHQLGMAALLQASLDELFERDGSAVPMIVYQCIQAVDLFGLEVEGIYRLSGTASHIQKIKAMFDNGEDQKGASLHVRLIIARCVKSRFPQPRELHA